MWNKFDDEYLVRLVRMNLSLERIAQKFVCTVPELQERIAKLEREGKFPQPEKEDVPPPEKVVPRDVLQATFVETCANYEAIGENLAFMGRALSMNLTEEQVMAEAQNLEELHKKLLGKKLPLHLFIVRVLWDNYIFVPRPRVMPTSQPKESNVARNGNSPGEGQAAPANGGASSPAPDATA